MIVKETRIVFEPGDIVKITIHCKDKQCEGEFSLYPGKRSEMAKCPLCLKDWIVPGSSDKDKMDQKTVLDLAAAVARFKHEGSTLWSINLEIAGE